MITIDAVKGEISVALSAMTSWRSAAEWAGAQDRLRLGRAVEIFPAGRQGALRRRDPSRRGRGNPYLYGPVRLQSWRHACANGLNAGPASAPSVNGPPVPARRAAGAGKAAPAARRGAGPAGQHQPLSAGRRPARPQSRAALDALHLPAGTDWRWRPGFMAAPVVPRGIARPEPGSRLGDQAGGLARLPRTGAASGTVQPAPAPRICRPLACGLRCSAFPAASCRWPSICRPRRWPG
jgi:hypothetical protein